MLSNIYLFPGWESGTFAGMGCHYQGSQISRQDDKLEDFNLYKVIRNKKKLEKTNIQPHDSYWPLFAEI